MSVNTLPSQVLPPRESSLFKKILRHFKDKQFKNGLKICNQILSNPKYSEHGETLSMKGLILNSLGKKQEALEYVRKGLKNDVKSHVCWHVYGLLQKADHKYEEAIKCYRNALKLKKDSVQILSDLSLVQIQTRDLEGYRDSRYQLFSLRPAERSVWIGCALAYHLAGDHVTAINILSEYQKSYSTGNNFRNRNNRRHNNEIYEHSELLLYHVFILLECNRYEEALTLLDNHKNDIVDKVSYFEYICQIYLALNRFEDAQAILLEQLIPRNPENLSYFEILEKAKQIKNEAQRLELYEELSKNYPRSQTIARFPLTFISSLDIFKTKMDAYLKNGFRKGRPALFRDMKNLYISELKSSLTSFTCIKLSPLNENLNTKEIKEIIKKQRLIHLTPKIEIIENLLLNYVENFINNNTFDLDSEEEESATCLLWVYYFIAQHFDALKEFSLALYFANLALIHTPTLIDIFVIKAKIFKHAGLLEKAVKCLDEAQSLDTSDRYLNSKCAKYLIRINKIKEAEDMCLKFTREGVSASENLNEMQCMWFQNEVAKAHQRMGQMGLALVKCVQIDNHFEEINEDQFDFNTYCILKVTLRAYVKMIRLEDQLKSHRFFINAAKTAIEIYLRLYDNPIDNKSENFNNDDFALSASELRKLRNKQRKAMLKATAQKENDKAQKKNNAKRDNENKTEETEVIDPITLENTKDPLNDAARFLKPMKIFGLKREEIHLLAFEIYYRKGKLLLQLQCLKRAYKICLPNSIYYPSLLRQTLLFLNNLISQQEQLNETIRLVLKEELPKFNVFQIKAIDGGDHLNIFTKLPTVDEFIDKYLNANSKSFLIRIENIRVKHLLNKFNPNSLMNNKNTNETPISNGSSATMDASNDVIETLSILINDIAKLTDLSLDNCMEFYSQINFNDFGIIPGHLVESLRVQLHSLYPYASCFMNDKELEDINYELSVNDYFTAEPEEYNCNLPEEN